MQQTVTVHVPRNLYERIRRAAESSRRPVDEVLIEAISAAAPTLETPQSDMRSALAQMAFLNDAALWQAGRATVPPPLRERLAQLHARQQGAQLTADEQGETKLLEQLYRDTLLVRAQAAALLRQRGYDVADPSQFTPLE